VGGTQYQYSGLQPGGTYYWRVKTKNSCGTWGNYSGCFSFTVDPGPLSPPALQSPTNGATCQATSGTLSWSPVSGAAQYRVQIGTSCGSGAEYDVGGTQYQYSGLQPGGTYYWRVKTKNSCGTWGNYSGCFSFTVDPGPLSPPGLQSPTNGATCQATSGTLSWSPVSGAAQYRVQIGTSCGSGAEYDVGGTQYQYSGLQPGGTYYWRVKTKNSCGTWGNYSGCFSFTVDPGPLSPPALQSPTNGATCQATSGTLSWSPVSGAAQYRVQIGTSCGSGAEYDVGGTQYQYSGLQPGTTYHWRVRTRSGCGAWGEYSACYSFDTAPLMPPPDSVRASDGTYRNKVQVTWDAVPGASEYRVYRDGSAIGSWQSSTIYDDGNTTTCTTYRYQVKARNICGESDLSSSDSGYSATDEVCNGIDDDCDGQVDEGDVCDQPRTWYRDADGDGYGNPAVTTQAVQQPPGYVANGNDCDDNCSTCYPGGTEVCDGKDNDCDGQTDEGGVCDQSRTWYRDADGDGYGNPAVTTQAVQQPPGYVANGNDCDDNCSTCYPGGTEVCDGKDNDCDGQTDEGGVCDPGKGLTWYRDADGDGYGNPAVTTQAVQQPPGYVANDDDCNDNCSTCYPGRTEVCDGKDNDCDGQTDEGGVCDPSRTWYRDADGDGYGNPAVTTQAVQQPPGYVANDDDCNDADAQVNPGIADCANSPDRIDNDCNGLVDDDQSCRDDGGGGLCPVVAMVILAVSCVGLARSLGRRQ